MTTDNCTGNLSSCDYDVLSEHQHTENSRHSRAARERGQRRGAPDSRRWRMGRDVTAKDPFRLFRDAIYSPRFKSIPAYRFALPLYCVFSTLYLLGANRRDDSAVLRQEITKRALSFHVDTDADSDSSSQVTASAKKPPAVAVEPAVYSSSNSPDVVVWPISFSAPETTWIPVVPAKNVDFATIIPGNLNTYVYDDELSYYEGYRCVLTCDVNSHLRMRQTTCSRSSSSSRR